MQSNGDARWDEDPRVTEESIQKSWHKVHKTKNCHNFSNRSSYLKICLKVDPFYQDRFAYRVDRFYRDRFSRDPFYQERYNLYTQTEDSYL